MTTPPCTAITKAGTVCGKSTATIPTAEGPRCYTHIKREQRLADPGSRPPIRNPKSADDVKRVVTWAMMRAAENKLSAPSANAVAGMARVWLRVNADRTKLSLDALWDLVEAQQAMQESMGVTDPSRFAAARQRMQAAWDRVRELQPSKESAEDRDARELRRHAREEHERAISLLDPDDGAGLDGEEVDL
jgi:hypothetical protein